MALTLNGSLGITFPSGNTQSDSALVTSGGTLSGPLTINGNLNFASGTNGIIFNNSNASVNSTLNDYETGTWTPTLVNSSNITGGTSGITVNAARYTKVGKVVFIYINVTFTVTSSSTNTYFAFSAPFAQDFASLPSVSGAGAGGNYNPWCLVDYSGNDNTNLAFVSSAPPAGSQQAQLGGTYFANF